MAHFFTFASRACPIRFFEEDPITVTLFIGDETDKLCLKSAELIGEGDSAATPAERAQKYREAVELLLGKEKLDAILARAEAQDSFALLEIWQFAVRTLRDTKVKNLSASVR